jgi:hypothetical protein
MLNIATMVRVLPIPMRLRREEKVTMSQTELRGVRVWELMREKNLDVLSSVSTATKGEERGLTLRMEVLHHGKMHMPSSYQRALPNIQ